MNFNKEWAVRFYVKESSIICYTIVSRKYTAFWETEHTENVTKRHGESEEEFAARAKKVGNNKLDLIRNEYESVERLKRLLDNSS